MNYYLIKNRMTKRDLDAIKGSNMSIKKEDDNFIEFVIACVIISTIFLLLSI